MAEDNRNGRTVKWREVLWWDIRYGLASLLREPGFMAVAVGVLALGIGANAAMFSLLDAVLLKPLPFPQSERIVRVWEAPRAGVTNATSTLDYLDWKRLAPEFEALSAERPIFAALSGSGEPVRLSGKAVTAEYFRVFGAHARLGRVFTPEEDQPGAAAAVVLSHAAWQTHFGGDPAVLQRRVILDGDPHQVVGVLPPGAFDRDQVQIWKPLVFTADQQVRQIHWLTVHGRLREGTTLAQARERMQAIDAALTDVTPVYKRDWMIVVEPLERLLVGDNLRRSLLIAFGAAFLVLLIAAANVANLLLARGAGRKKELAVRAALGASRARLAAQLLTESFVLCILGGAAGIALALLLLELATPLLGESLPYTADVRLDSRVFGFAALVVLGVTLAVGALPALHTKFGDLAGSLNQSARGSSGARRGIRRVIVVGEVALSLVLVCAAGLLFRSLLNLQRLDSGARIDNILTIAASLPANVYPTAESATLFYESATERLDAVPGVSQLALTTHVPLRWIGNGEGMKVQGVQELVNVRFKRVDPGYFDAFDIPVVAGRGITRRDRLGAPGIVVINEALAARLREVGGGRDPVGQVVSLTGPSYVEKVGTTSDVEIVGVIRSERTDVPWRPDRPVVYVPLAQAPAPSITLIVRTQGDAAAVVPGIREAVRQIAPSLPLGRIATMQQIRADTFSGAAAPATIIGAFATVAALLAALGLYGVLAHVVVHQRREIGIRMALGARAADIVSHVLRDGLSMVVAGLALGLIAAVALTRLMGNLLYHVSPLDPVALTLACVSMLCVALLAGLLPASCAARVQPVAVLREEG
jgi:putative ABC transport system permease protein